MTDQEKDLLILKLTACLKIAFSTLPTNPRRNPEETLLARGCEHVLAQAELYGIQMTPGTARTIVTKAALVD